MTLTIQDLGALGELLGSIAVLATLVYLALQMRQNTMAIGAQLDAARISALQTLNLAVATSSELQEAVLEDRADEISLNDLRRQHYWAAQLHLYNWSLFQSRHGVLPSFDLSSQATFVRFRFSSSRSYGDFWDSSKGAFPRPFVEWVEEQRPKAA